MHNIVYYFNTIISCVIFLENLNFTNCFYTFNFRLNFCVLNFGSLIFFKIPTFKCIRSLTPTLMSGHRQAHQLSASHRAKPDDIPTVHRTKAVRKLQWAREASVHFSVKGLARHPTIATKLYICDKIQRDGNDCNSSARARGVFSARVGRLLETRGISLRSVEILNCGGPLAG